MHPSCLLDGLANHIFSEVVPVQHAVTNSRSKDFSHKEKTTTTQLARTIYLIVHQEAVFLMIQKLFN